MEAKVKMASDLKKLVLLALLMGFFHSPRAYAALYEYTDDKGVPCVASKLTDVPQKYRQNLRNIAEQPIAKPDEAYLARKKAAEDRAAIQAKMPKGPDKVDLYLTSWCPYCRKLENFLNDHHIVYTRHDIEADPASAEEFGDLGGEGVPLTRIGNKVIYGYDPEKVLQALKK